MHAQNPNSSSEQCHPVKIEGFCKLKVLLEIKKEKEKGLEGIFRRNKKDNSWHSTLYVIIS